MRERPVDSPPPLIWLSSPPYRGSRLRTGLDLLLAYAVFAQQPVALFSGDAVHALLPHPRGAASSRPSLRKIIDSLPLYDVERIWVDADSLTEAAIEMSALPDFAQPADAEQFRRLVDGAGHVVSI